MDNYVENQVKSIELQEKNLVISETLVNNNSEMLEISRKVMKKSEETLDEARNGFQELTLTEDDI